MSFNGRSYRSKGFTLIELMVVVIIMSIMVALTVPNYINTREKALDKEAVAALRLVYAANKHYFSKLDHYYPTAGSPTIANINANLSIALSSGAWNYALSGTGATFSATAGRGGRTWTVNQGTSTPACSGTCL